MKRILLWVQAAILLVGFACVYIVYTHNKPPEVRAEMPPPAPPVDINPCTGWAMENRGWITADRGWGMDYPNWPLQAASPYAVRKALGTIPCATMDAKSYADPEKEIKNLEALRQRLELESKEVIMLILALVGGIVTGIVITGLGIVFVGLVMGSDHDQTH